MVSENMLRVEQLFDPTHVNEVSRKVRREMKKLELAKVRGKRVAVTAGSRGIPNIRRIMLTVVVVLKEAGADPFIVPCMGSHGGATAEGQVSLLDQYGITETSMRCPIDGTMDVVELGKESDLGQTVYWSKNLIEADFTILVNRIKPHTLFCGDIESGLSKMAAVGGGRKRGAESVHERSQQLGLERAIVGAAERIFADGNILGGLGIIDNAFHQTAVIEAIPLTSAEDFMAHETKLLKRACEMLAQIRFQKVDVLYLSEMGKNISGSGSDPNVIGRKPGGWRRDKLERPGQAEIAYVCCSSLTTESHGNAGALGLHDAVSQRLINQVNWDDTRVNAEVSGATDIIMPRSIHADDITMLHAARSIALTQTDDPRIVLARNTNDLRVLYISNSLRTEAEQNENIKILSEDVPLNFDDEGHVDMPFEVHI